MTIQIQPVVTHVIEYGVFHNAPSMLGPLSGNYKHNITLKTVHLELLVPSGFREGQGVVTTTLEDAICKMIPELFGSYAPRRDGEIGEFGE